MEMETMGRVLTEATIENLEDLWSDRRGALSADQVRRVIVTDALVDTQGLRITFLRDLSQYSQEELIFPTRQETTAVDAFPFAILHRLE
jgi:hypothetical protein